MKYVLTICLASFAARADIPVVKGDDLNLNVGAMMQALGFGQQLDDPYTNDDRVYLFVKEARLRANGNYRGIAFNTEMALGGEEAISATTGVSLSLLDMSVNVPIGLHGSYVKVGQFKVPYCREQLTYSGSSQFVARSMENLGFEVGRDVGLAVTLRPGPLTFIGGIFTGGGRDVPPQHYLPERFGLPEVVARVGFGDVDTDEYELANDPFSRTTRAAFFINGLYMKDSTVGHSTVLNVKLADKSLLIDGNWNPYIGRSPYSQGDLFETGADFALRTPLTGSMSLSAEAEVNWAGYSNGYGVLHIAGARAQAGIGFSPVEIALRYSVLVPDKNFANGGVAITGTQAMQELTPSVAYYLDGQRLKLVADLPLLINTVVFTEPHIGSYVGVELPDQVTVIAKGGTAARQTVVEGRLMMQAWF